jgi:hypothetical protein
LLTLLFSFVFFAQFNPKILEQNISGFDCTGSTLHNPA